MDSTERELKLLLSKEQYDMLCKDLPCDEIRKQTNTYYDTKDHLLKDHACALRIRAVNGKHILTIKKPLDSITKYEYERPVQAATFDELTDEEKDWAFDHLGFGRLDLHPFMQFTTLRRIANLDHAELSLDQTDFAHHTDYELEYEYRGEHDGRKVFNDLLQPFHMKYEKNGPSKLARAVMDSIE